MTPDPELRRGCLVIFILVAAIFACGVTVGYHYRGSRNESRYYHHD